MPLFRFFIWISICSVCAVPVWAQVPGGAKDESGERLAAEVPLCYTDDCVRSAEQDLDQWLASLVETSGKKGAESLQHYAALAARAQRSPVCTLLTSADGESPAPLERLSKPQREQLYKQLAVMANNQQEAFLGMLPARSPDAQQEMLLGDPSTGIGRLIMVSTPQGSPKETILKHYREWQPTLVKDVQERALSEQTLCAFANQVAARYANTLNLDWIFWGMRADWFSQPRYDRYGRKLPMKMDYPKEPTAAAQKLLGQALQWHVLAAWLESKQN